MNMLFYLMKGDSEKAKEQYRTTLREVISGNGRGAEVSE